MFYVTCMYVYANVFQVYVNKCVISELKRVIEDSEVRMQGVYWVSVDGHVFIVCVHVVR